MVVALSLFSEGVLICAKYLITFYLSIVIKVFRGESRMQEAEIISDVMRSEKERES